MRQEALFATESKGGAGIAGRIRFELSLQAAQVFTTHVGVGLPYMLHCSAWPYRADLTHFGDLPVRNPSLLFAARAYTRPEYAELWKTLNPDPTIPEIERCFPISQPLLWIGKARL